MSDPQELKDEIRRGYEQLQRYAEEFRRIFKADITRYCYGLGYLNIGRFIDDFVLPYAKTPYYMIESVLTYWGRPAAELVLKLLEDPPPANEQERRYHQVLKRVMEIVAEVTGREIFGRHDSLCMLHPLITEGEIISAIEREFGSEFRRFMRDGEYDPDDPENSGATPRTVTVAILEAMDQANTTRPSDLPR